MKTDKYDKVFSDLIREAANYQCDKCQRNFRYQPASMHCSHYKSRRHQRTRFEPGNVFAHCVNCHIFYEHNPEEFKRWMIEQRGEEHEIRMTQLANSVYKFGPDEKEDMYQFYKSSLEKIREMRAFGDTIKITVPSFFEVASDT